MSPSEREAMLARARRDSPVVASMLLLFWDAKDRGMQDAAMAYGDSAIRMREEILQPKIDAILKRNT